ncbi:hypothetical protein GUITHDRAFT_51522, partial [Guillardia theta CCMP2712]
KHEHIVELLGVAQNEPVGFNSLVMEFSSMGSLDRVLQTAKAGGSGVSNVVLVEAAKQACEGMLHLHQNGIIHCNLAAHNLMVMSFHASDYRSVRVKVADYLSSLFLPRRGERTQGRVSSREDDVRWQAPETISSGTHSSKSDVWSYGIVLWQIWSMGSLPFPHLKTPREVKDRVLRGEVPGRLPSSTCPDKVYSTMELCWGQQPHKRTSF